MNYGDPLNYGDHMNYGDPLNYGDHIELWRSHCWVYNWPALVYLLWNKYKMHIYKQ